MRRWVRRKVRPSSAQNRAAASTVRAQTRLRAGVSAAEPAALLSRAAADPERALPPVHLRESAALASRVRPSWNCWRFAGSRWHSGSRARQKPGEILDRSRCRPNCASRQKPPRAIATRRRTGSDGHHARVRVKAPALQLPHSERPGSLKVAAASRCRSALSVARGRYLCARSCRKDRRQPIHCRSVLVRTLLPSPFRSLFTPSRLPCASLLCVPCVLRVLARREQGTSAPDQSRTGPDTGKRRR